MSTKIKIETLRKYIKELIKQELDEANSTASVGGEYSTPHAFKGSNKKGKKKGKAGYKGGHGNPTIGTDNFEPKDPKLRKEGRYHDFRNDDSKTPKQKIGLAMRETRNSLTELERVVRYNVKLKNLILLDI